MIQIDNPQVEQYIYPPRQLATTSSALTFTIYSDLTLKKYSYEVEDEGRGQYFKFKVDLSNADQGEYTYTIKEYFNTVGQGLIRIGKVSDATPDCVAYNPDDVEVEQYYYDANYEDRSVEYTSNGDYEVLPSAGYDALSRVRVTVNVPTIDPEEVITSAVTEANAYTDSALADYATTAVTETKLNKPNTSIGGTGRPIYYNRYSGLTACNTTTLVNGRWNALVADVAGNTMVGRYLVFHSGATDNSTSVQFGKNPTKGGFTVYYPNTGTDYTVSSNQHFVVDSDDIVHIKKITQADYDALVSAGTVDEHTLYLIEN